MSPDNSSSSVTSDSVLPLLSHPQVSTASIGKTMKSTFMDPMIADQKAMETLFLDTGLPEEYCCFMLSLFTSWANISIVYTSIPDTPVGLHCTYMLRCGYIMDLFNARSTLTTTPVIGCLL
ncbi:hypothetical protein PAXRUDRAFT_153530 [Paxillus rubicundulus Ve08.2h10]|uniref:Uncharacterized protein n=1 Tax=Paxillus rubicundulus Ve08.2h10 TaxID=930991 RepID=A0A0D0DS36_9AGAM|nr:hypothetical protein PAXRUDRAFT_153530 [Paxillus rubicundulus Ve08.2h10]